MLRNNLLAFLKDENASIAIEYAALAGTVGVGWLYAGRTYQRELISLFDRMSHTLERVSANLS